MALKDLLVYVDQSQDAVTRLRLAADLAFRHGSRLTALFVREWTRDQQERRKAAELGLVSAEGMRQLDESTRASIGAVEAALRTTLDEVIGDSAQADLLCLDGEAGVLVPQYACYADLCIVGPDEPAGSTSVNSRFPSNSCSVSLRAEACAEARQAMPADKIPPFTGWREAALRRLPSLSAPS